TTWSDWVAFQMYTPTPTIFGLVRSIDSTTSTGRWLMSNSRIRACARSSPRFAIKYRNPNAQCAYFAFSVVRMMSGILAVNYVTPNARSNARIILSRQKKPARVVALLLLERRQRAFLATHTGPTHQPALGYR